MPWAGCSLLTLHKGKGLEFRHAFLAGWDSAFPSSWNDAAEERRLAYVAITRGKERVSISHAAYRRGYAQPSCFIDDIPDERKVTGWLREQQRPRFMRRVGGRFTDDVDAMELLRQL